MKFTVLGGQGYIGSHLVTYLRQQGHECFCPAKDDDSIFFKHLGHVIYCIGLTADFRLRPFDTARAHVGVLTEVLDRCHFDSLLYLSSTRVYGNSDNASENAKLSVNPQSASDLYNLTKLTGEALCFATKRSSVRVARLSNVYGIDMGSDNFLASIIQDARQKKRVIVNTSPNSKKDYVYIGDVVELLTKIALSAKLALYNIASGVNTSNKELLAYIQKLTNCEVIFSENAPTTNFPLISIELAENEFGFSARHLESMLKHVVPSC